MNKRTLKQVVVPCILLASILATIGGASASVINSSNVGFDLSTLNVSGDISPYVYTQAIPNVQTASTPPYSGPVSMVSSYAESAGSWYGFYTGVVGATVPWASNAGVGTAAQAGAVVAPSVSANANANAGGSGFSEAWVINIYGFTAKTTGQVDFSINYDLGLNLTTDFAGESAKGWAFAGMQILSDFPIIDADDVQHHPDFPLESFINGNDIFSIDNYNDKLSSEVSDGNNYNFSQPGQMLTTTANVIAGETFFMVLAGYTGAGKLPPTTTAVVSEPGMLLLMSMGLTLICGVRRRTL